VPGVAPTGIVGKGLLLSILLGRRVSACSTERVEVASFEGVVRDVVVTNVLRRFAAGSRKLRVDARRFSTIMSVLLSQLQ